MRLGLWGLAALILGALIAQVLLQDRGYVLIDFRGYAVEMSVPGLLLAWAAVYALIRALAAVWRAPGRLGRRLAHRKVRRAGGRLTQALLRMAEGDWAKGERLLTQGLNGSQAPLAHYLLAARAAQVQGSASRRDEWLKIAYEEMPEAETPILLTRAELQLEGGDHERALATLRRIERRSPRHPQVLAMLARACGALEDHGRLVELLPRVAKRARIEPEALLRLVRPALEAQFAGPEVTRAELDAYWAKLPGAFRRIAGAIVLRARLLERLGHGEQA
jgi:HemY protein